MRTAPDADKASDRQRAGSSIQHAGQTWVELGRVRRSHGQDGSLAVGLHGDDPDSILAASEVLLSGEVATIQFQVRECEPLGVAKGGHLQVRVALEGIGDRDAAEVWTGAKLHVLEQALPSLPEGEFYWRDLIGATCRLRNGEVLGIVDEIWPTGANDVLVVKGNAEAILIPALDEVLLRLDREQNELWVELPEGFLSEDEGTS